MLRLNVGEENITSSPTDCVEMVKSVCNFRKEDKNGK